MERYSVSLVYTKPENDVPHQTTITTLLRVLITNAVSEEEALGKAIKEFDQETKEMSLLLKVVLPVKEPTS